MMSCAVNKYQKTFKGLTSCIYQRQKRSSKKRDHQKPSYTLDELREWIKKQKNFLQLFKEWEKSNYDTFKKPSIDRLDNSKGYNFDNIELVTWEENLNRGRCDRNYCVKSVSMVCKYSNEKLKTFESISEAAKYLKKDRQAVTHIRRSALSSSHTAYGYKWVYND